MSEMEEVMASESMTLDESQRRAICHALSSRVAIIQGPPGTGKSYVGSKVIQLLLSMDTLPDGPIVLMTFKNKALDTTLNECLHFTSDVVRVGGQCKEQALQCKMLQRLYRERMNTQENFHAKRLLRQSSQELEHIRYQAQEWARELEYLTKLNKGEIIISFKSFLQVANIDQISAIIADDSERAQVMAVINEIGPRMLFRKIRECPTEFEILTQNFKKWLPPAEVVQQIIDNEIDNSNTLRAESEPNHNEEDSEKEATLRRMDAEDFEDWRDQTENMLVSSVNFAIGARFVTKNMHKRTDLMAMAAHQRAHFLLALLSCARTRIQHGFATSMQEYHKVSADLKDTIDGVKLQVLRSARIVGFTVTGGAIFSRLISALRPSVVIIEEAGEVLEPHMIAAMPSSAQHYILIGDHKQLRPVYKFVFLPCFFFDLSAMCNYAIAREYKLDISQMERIINNNSPHVTLCTQNRMRSELVPFMEHFYPDVKLESGQHVNALRHPTCLTRSFFFWEHNAEEQRTHDGAILNHAEAHMCVFLASWLVWNSEGGGSDVSILSFYKAQVNLIKDLLAKIYDNPNLPSHYTAALQNVFVGTVDGFQGAENKSIILSVVRCNRNREYGFSAIPNRVCVALSRAQCGLYVVGSKNFLVKSLTWAPMVKKLHPVSNITVKCPRHPEKLIQLSSTELSTAHTLCRQLCSMHLATCDHLCASPCHGGPHPPCSVQVAFKCKCGEEESVRCGYPQELLLCIKCSKHEDNLDPAQLEALRKYKLRVKYAKQIAEVWRGSENYARVAKHVVSYLTPADQSAQTEVVRVQKVGNPALRKQWYQRRLGGNVTNITWRCYVPEAIQRDDILHYGFKHEFKQKESLGKGIYFSSRHLSDTDTNEDETENGQNVKYVILCKVLEGNSREVSGSYPSMHPSLARAIGVDSASYKSSETQHTAYYDHELILPKYLVQVKSTKAWLAFSRVKRRTGNIILPPPINSIGTDNAMHYRLAEGAVIQALPSAMATLLQIRKVALRVNASYLNDFNEYRKNFKTNEKPLEMLFVAVWKHEMWAKRANANHGVHLKRALNVVNKDKPIRTAIGQSIQNVKEYGSFESLIFEIHHAPCGEAIPEGCDSIIDSETHNVDVVSNKQVLPLYEVDFELVDQSKSAKRHLNTCQTTQQKLIKAVSLDSAC